MKVFCAITVIPFASASPVHHDIVFIPEPVVWLVICPMCEGEVFATDPFEIIVLLLIRQANPILLRSVEFTDQEIEFTSGVDCDQIAPQALSLRLGLLPSSRLQQAIK